MNAAVLRNAPLTILGTAGTLPMEVLSEAFHMAHAANGRLRFETERVPLSKIENAWTHERHGRRLVVIP